MTNVTISYNAIVRKYVSIILISLLAIALRLWWWNYTNFTAEDAHITFQFAKQIAAGNGFVFNAGERVYGTTTPLLTLLLAILPFSPILASKLIGLASVVGGLWFLYFALPYRKAAILATLLLAVSMKLIAEDMQGMESPLLFLFITGSYYGYTKDRPYFSGMMCGLLLWTRIDSIAFVVALFCSFLFFGTMGRLWTSTVKFAIGTFVYVPWLVFAQVYFGSPIPYTIIAKSVAYGINSPPLPVHFLRIIDYISWPAFLLTILSILYLGRRNLFLALFFTANILILAKGGATFFPRYFYTITVVSIIMISIMVARIRGVIWKALIVFMVLYGSSNWNSHVGYYKNLQVKRNDVLENIGVWLNQNTPEDSTILLEPLGYIGYYADRTMLDEVGLVTPRVVELHRQGVKSYDFYKYLWPDYILLQCTQPQGDIGKYYEKIKIFDNGYARACYYILGLK